MATTWSIARRTGACALSGRPFADGERHVSFLRIEEGRLERVDVSLEAWRERRAELEAAGARGDEPLFFWTTRHEVEKKKTVQLDLDSLDRLFVQLEGRPERAVRELRYVLCLLLMRKRRVKVERVVRKDGEESFLVKRPRDEERYTVYVYDFEPEELDALRAQLQAVFDGAEGPCGVRLGPDEDEPDQQDGEGPREDPSGEDRGDHGVDASPVGADGETRADEDPPEVEDGGSPRD